MNWLRRLMYGRNGSDHLTLFLFVLYAVIATLGNFTNQYLLMIAAVVPLLYGLWRMLSRNLSKRREENARFLAMFRPLRSWFKTRRAMHTDKAHRYFKCPNCGQMLRVPRGKGKIQVTCRSCGVSFEETT